MHFICLTPTHGRPSLAANALALFLGQDLHVLTGHTAHLVIYDDADQIPPQGKLCQDRRRSWQVISERKWIPLPAKYNALLDRLGGPQNDPDVWYVVKDDDDVYLPWHLGSIAIAAAREPEACWTKPSRIWSTYTEQPSQSIPERLHEEDASGRFHGSIAIRGDLLYQLGGWPETLLATFDQQQISRLYQSGHPADPTRYLPLSYVYRWGDTGKHHASGSIDHDGYYRRPPIQEKVSGVTLGEGTYDASALEILRHLAAETVVDTQVNYRVA